MSKLTSLPGIPWSPQAALAVARDRLPEDALALACLWLDADGQVRWSVAGNNAHILWLIEKSKFEVMIDAMPDLMRHSDNGGT